MIKITLLFIIIVSKSRLSLRIKAFAYILTDYKHIDFYFLTLKLTFNNLMTYI